MLSQNKARNHHYAPQFYLRNFSFDSDRRKVHSIAKYGERAIWQARSIESIGRQEDLYWSTVDGVSFSVEDDINRYIETPLTNSTTWDKISNDKAEDLGPEDATVIFNLISHFQRRTPHAKQTMLELIDMAKRDPQNFNNEELEIYAALEDPEFRELFTVKMFATLDGSIENHERTQILICRSRIPLWTSTTPVLATGVPDMSGLHLPLPSQQPHASLLTLNRFSFVVLALADSGGPSFENLEITEAEAIAYNRFRVGQFRHFQQVDHLICDQSGLADQMEWAGYGIEKRSAKRIVFIRSDSQGAS